MTKEEFVYLIKKLAVWDHSYITSDFHTILAKHNIKSNISIRSLWGLIWNARAAALGEDLSEGMSEMHGTVEIYKGFKLYKEIKIVTLNTQPVASTKLFFLLRFLKQSFN